MVRRERGFTLIELMVASVVMLAVVVAATQLFASLVHSHRRDVERATLRAAAERVLTTMAHDLRLAGLGVPEGGNLATGAPFPPAVFLAAEGQVGFVADLPRPDAAFNGYSELAGEQPGGAVVVLLNELSGDCGSDTGSRCNTLNDSLAVRPAAGASGCGADAASATCPWAQRRYRAAEKVVVANGMGVWAELTVAATLSAALGGRRGLALTTVPTHLGTGNLPRRGFVSTPDRVFYRLAGTSVERGQCWGAWGNTPSASDACVTGAEGTGWEVLARGVSRFLLGYRRADGTAIAIPAAGATAGATRRLSVTLETTRTAGRETFVWETTTTLATRR